MSIRPGIKSALWMFPGAVFMLLLVLLVGHFQKEQNPALQLAFKARRVDLVSRMQLGLSSAAEAEKSAVMAITDQESKVFADQARAATAEVEQKRRELKDLLKTDGTQAERGLLDQFSQAFTEFQRVDKDLLDLAVKNTNLKAYDLAFGPAADALDEMNRALSRIIAAHIDSPDAKKVMLLAFGAQIDVLHIQTLLPPHIAEESDRKMDKLEASMAREDAQVRKGFDGLKALPSLSGDSCSHRLAAVPSPAASASRRFRRGPTGSEVRARTHTPIHSDQSRVSNRERMPTSPPTRASSRNAHIRPSGVARSNPSNSGTRAPAVRSSSPAASAVAATVISTSAW